MFRSSIRHISDNATGKILMECVSDNNEIINFEVCVDKTSGVSMSRTKVHLTSCHKPDPNNNERSNLNLAL